MGRRRRRDDIYVITWNDGSMDVSPRAIAGLDMGVAYLVQVAIDVEGEMGNLVAGTEYTV